MKLTVLWEGKIVIKQIPKQMLHGNCDVSRSFKENREGFLVKVIHGLTPKGGIAVNEDKKEERMFLAEQPAASWSQSIRWTEEGGSVAWPDQPGAWRHEIWEEGEG